MDHFTAASEKMMRSEGHRQSDRVNYRMPVEASWFASGGVTVKQTAQTVKLTAHIRRDLVNQLLKSVLFNLGSVGAGGIGKPHRPRSGSATSSPE